MRRVVRALRASVAVSIMLASAMYVCAVTVHVMPDNPAKVRLVGYSDRVIVPLFRQTWTLFAPNPPDSSDVLTYAVKFAGGADSHAEAEWIPLSAAFIAAEKGSLLPGRLDRSVSAFRSMINTLARADAKLQRGVATKPPDDPRLAGVRASEIDAFKARLAGEQRRIYRPLGKLVEQVASARFPGRQVIAVKVSMHRQPVRPFSRRNSNFTPAPQPVYVTDWIPVGETDD